MAEHQQRSQFNHASFEGFVHTIVPRKGSDKLIVVLKTHPQLKEEPTLLRFFCSQDKFKWLFDRGRLNEGFTINVSGRISSVSGPTEYSEGLFTIHLVDTHVDESNLYHEKYVEYTVTSTAKPKVVSA